MMRNRMVCPELFREEDLYDAESTSGIPVVRCYIALWCASDREGRFEWSPRALKIECAPYDTFDFSVFLDLLIGLGDIVCYKVGSKLYGLCVNFHAHQSINGRESASVIPPISEGEVVKSSERGLEKLSQMGAIVFTNGKKERLQVQKETCGEHEENASTTRQPRVDDVTRPPRASLTNRIESNRIESNQTVNPVEDPTASSQATPKVSNGVAKVGEWDTVDRTTPEWQELRRKAKERLESKDPDMKLNGKPLTKSKIKAIVDDGPTKRETQEKPNTANEVARKRQLLRDQAKALCVKVKP